VRSSGHSTPTYKTNEQTKLVIPWGYAADYYGRKPVLLVSLLGATTSTVLFGFSTKIWQMIAARCIAGVFGGNAVVVRTVGKRGLW
jgi:MFS family permease